MAEMYYPPIDLAASNTDSGQRCPERAGEPASDLLLSCLHGKACASEWRFLKEHGNSACLCSGQSTREMLDLTYKQ